MLLKEENFWLIVQDNGILEKPTKYFTQMRWVHLHRKLKLQTLMYFINLGKCRKFHFQKSILNGRRRMFNREFF